MVDTVRSWPEYNEVHESLQEMVVNVEHIAKLIWEILVSLRGNVFNDWEHNGNSLCFVITCIKFHNAEYN